MRFDASGRTGFGASANLFGKGGLATLRVGARDPIETADIDRRHKIYLEIFEAANALTEDYRQALTEADLPKELLDAGVFRVLPANTIIRSWPEDEGEDAIEEFEAVPGLVRKRLVKAQDNGEGDDESAELLVVTANKNDVVITPSLDELGRIQSITTVDGRAGRLRTFFLTSSYKGENPTAPRVDTQPHYSYFGEATDEITYATFGVVAADAFALKTGRKVIGLMGKVEYASDALANILNRTKGRAVVLFGALGASENTAKNIVADLQKLGFRATWQDVASDAFITK